jgi:hypothetical protein
LEKRISKTKGFITVNRNTEIDTLLKSDAIIERMVNYAEATTCSGQSDTQVRNVLRNYVRGMLEAARA